MRVLVTSNYQTLSQQAAEAVADAVRLKPDLVLGLPTGHTPLGMYQELVRQHHEKGLDFSRVSTFNLDEYLGFSRKHPASYTAYMRHHFFDRVNVATENIHIPDGGPDVDAESESARYEQAIREAGGIDLLIVGIGTNGHIAFNEPGANFTSRTRPVDLAPETVSSARQYFESEAATPRRAITVGIATILDAGRILLLAAGSGKSHASARAIQGPVSESMPASALQLHADVTAILDQAAAANLSGY
jgi:glucosamine-6-phosphate deaminase